MLLDQLHLVLAAVMALGGLVNLVAPEKIRTEYKRWGYPAGFQYATAALEFGAAWLLTSEVHRPWGAVLAAAIMTAACATMLLHGDGKRVLAPLCVLALSVFVALRM